jgi:hypothetical protein
MEEWLIYEVLLELTQVVFVVDLVVVYFVEDPFEKQYLELILLHPLI